MSYNTVNTLIEQKWTVDNITQKLSNIKVLNTSLYERYVKVKKGQISPNFSVTIKRGDGVILKSISPEAEPMFFTRDDVYEFDAKTARFALENIISPSVLNEIESYDIVNKPIALASEIGIILREHKKSIDTTLEYLTAGALFNKVIDGNGKVLFELENKAKSITFDDTTELKTSINEVTRTVKNVLKVPNIRLSALCGSGFMDSLSAKCSSQDLFSQGIAKYIYIDGLQMLEVYGVIFNEYSLTYKNNKGKDIDFISPNSAVFIPENYELLECVYSRANDISAIGKSPSLYFSAIEQLPRGRGYSIRSESRFLVYNTLPEAMVHATFSK